MKLLFVLLAITLLPYVSSSQETHVCQPPPPKTVIGAMEERTGTVVVKGLAEIGFIGCTHGSIAVVCKESTDTVSTQRVYGAAITVKGRDRLMETTLLDYDELDSLLKALARINGPQWNETSLGSYEATWTSKDGLRVSTFNNRATGAVEAAIQTTRLTQATALLSSAQLETFRNFIDQTKAKIESIKPK